MRAQLRTEAEIILWVVEHDAHPRSHDRRICNTGGMLTGTGKARYSEKVMISAALSISNPTWTAR
jgi:hypothetical protein